MSHPVHHDHASGSSADDLQTTAVHGYPEMGHDAHAAHRAGHAAGGEHAGHTRRCFAPFWIALLLTLPGSRLRRAFEELLGYTAPRFPGSEWLVALLASVIYWYCGWVFLTGAVASCGAARPA